MFVTEPKKARVLSVEKALGILNLFKENSELSLAAVSQKKSIPKTTAFGLVASLLSNNYLEQDTDTGRYRLGMAIFELAGALRDRVDIKTEAAKLLGRLSEKYEQNVHITILREAEVVYLESLIPPGKMMLKTVTGSGAPANCTATGKAFLACLSKFELRQLFGERELTQLTANSITDFEKLCDELKKVRAVGYAVDNEESIVGVRGVGMLVKNGQGKPLIGISIAGPSSRITDATEQSYVKDLKSVSDELFIKFSGTNSI